MSQEWKHSKIVPSSWGKGPVLDDKKNHKVFDQSRSRGLLPIYAGDEDGLPSISAQSCTPILSEYWWLPGYK